MIVYDYTVHILYSLKQKPLTEIHDASDENSHDIFFKSWRKTQKNWKMASTIDIRWLLEMEMFAIILALFAGLESSDFRYLQIVAYAPRLRRPGYTFIVFHQCWEVNYNTTIKKNIKGFIA